MSGSPFSLAALDYFSAHAIDPQLATAVGVDERAGALRFPCSASGGSTYHRERPLNGAGPAKTKQPAGQPLDLWWPRGRSRKGSALLCEGESDALAALKPLSESRFAGLAVAAIPGTGFPQKRLADQLAEAGVREAFLALDGDAAGRAYAGKAAAALGEAGIRSIVVELEDGTDLAENFARVEDRTDWIENTLADAEAAADEIAAHMRPTGDDAATAKPPSQATRLVALALERVDLFRSPDGVAYATIRAGDHRETWPLRSSLEPALEGRWVCATHAGPPRSAT